VNFWLLIINKNKKINMNFVGRKHSTKWHQQIPFCKDNGICISFCLNILADYVYLIEFSDMLTPPPAG
jgi:hypothetical protein